MVKEVGESNIWNINKAFLDQQLKQRKTIILSHNPNKATGYYAKEVEYLVKRGYRFVKYGTIWKAKMK